MTPTPPTPADAELLLEHAQWVRRLARSLVGDAERADELAQETWVRVFERPPRLDRPFRGWIATVMRNLVRAERRGAARRATREESCARPEAEPSSHELVERASLQRELVQAVLELAEPYRATILLRYFEERTPLEIAARERVPVATVKTRLARALAQLRERLARAHAPDGETNVLSALAALALPRPRPWLPLTLGTIAVNAKLLATLALLAVAGLTYLLWMRADAGESARPVAAAPSAPPAEPEHTSGGAAVLEPGASRERVETPARPAPRPAEAAPRGARLRVRGRAIDPRTRPVAGVAVGFYAGEDGPPAAAKTLGQTDAGGAFELELPAPSGHLVVNDERWTTILAGTLVDAASGQESLIVVAPRIELAGEVVDEFGLPQPRVLVRLEPPEDLRARLTAVLDFSAGVRLAVETDELGRFRFADAPGLEDARLTVREDGFLPRTEPAPAESRADIVLVLARPALTSNVLAGVVLDPARSPVPDAVVSMGVDTTRTDEHGRFAFRLDDPDSSNHMLASLLTVDASVLRAVKPGYLPAELHARGATAAGEPLWPQSVVLSLGGEPLSIAGVVSDGTGKPLPGVSVWLADPTFFGGLRRESRGDPSPRLTHLENVLAGAEPGWHSVDTDERGRFELGGLLEREYVVAAMAPETLLRVEVPHVRAGERNARIVLPSDASYAVLRGRVVDSHGAPVELATVFPMCDAFRTSVQGQVVSTNHASAAAVRTDGEGRFQLERVPRDLVYLRVEGPELLPLEWGRGLEGGLASLVGDKSDELVLEVERRCHFQVELAVPDEADELGVLDAHGQALTLSEFRGNGRRDMERQPLIGGRSSSLAVGDRAVALVLYRAGAEVRRVPIHLEGGGTTLLRP